MYWTYEPTISDVCLLLLGIITNKAVHVFLKALTQSNVRLKKLAKT